MNPRPSPRISEYIGNHYCQPFSTNKGAHPQIKYAYTPLKLGPLALTGLVNGVLAGTPSPRNGILPTLQPSP